MDEQKPEMTDAEILAHFQWTIECYSPFEIIHEDGGRATGTGAYHVLESVRSILRQQERNRADWDEKRRNEVAGKLSECARILSKYARCLRGEDQDLTDLGIWRIFCMKLGQVVGESVVIKEPSR